MPTDYTPVRPADFDYDAALSDLREKIRRKKKAQNLLNHFSEEAARLTSVMEDRKKEYEQEQEESDNLQSATLTLLFYSLLGVKEEKLSKEESEALAAKAAYETAKAELDHVLARQVELRAELRSLGNCEHHYESMLAEKKAWLLANKEAVNAEVEALEAEKTTIIRDSKELKEALESGQYALRVANSIVAALQNAQLLRIKDTMPSSRGGRSIGASIRDDEIDVKKRNALVRLNNSLQSLDQYLQDFEAELKDVSDIPMEYQLPTARFGSTLMFIDRWVDDLISEIVVDAKLNAMEKQMRPLLDAISPIVEGLEKEYAKREAACAEIDEKIRAVVLNR